MILKIFLLGAVTTVPVFFVQVGLQYFLSKINLSGIFYDLIYWFFVIAFTEEFFKFLVIKFKVISSSALDEPLDIMLYMVIAALGFAAVENILYLFSPMDNLALADVLSKTLLVSFVRFVGATFLHTLCSGVLGYFLAMSFCLAKNKNIILISGIFFATLLHGLYDFSIITLRGGVQVVAPIIIILILASLVFWGFDKLKKMKGLCKIN